MSRSVTFFPLAAISISLVALAWPRLFMDFQSAVIPLLGVIMFAMGATLSADDFRRVLARPRPVIAGLLLQYTLMPLIAWLLAITLQLPVPIMAGLVMVGACPGGTASNVICYLAGGHVALSITMTTLSTFLAVLLTPALAWLYLGERIPVPVADMMQTIFMIIILPVSLGVFINHYFGRSCARVKRYLPMVSMAAIVIIIGIIMAMNQAAMKTVFPAVLVAVMLHNLLGLGLGYALARLAGFDSTTCRTLAIEVGMQNSGLGVALSGKYFSALAALPGALFSIWHNISGAMLAAYWSSSATKKV